MMLDVSPRPASTPIGLRLARTARVVTQAFERAMAEAGGSVSTWQVLLLVRAQSWDTQSELAKELGVTGATLTHHLNALERKGLVRRWREESNRRVQRVELTEAGVGLFDRLREVARRHDRLLRSELSEAEVQLLGDLLERVQDGVQAHSAASAGREPA
jgi:MarR family transcriptional regulator for hemolysin